MRHSSELQRKLVGPQQRQEHRHARDALRLKADVLSAIRHHLRPLGHSAAPVKDRSERGKKPDAARCEEHHKSRSCRYSQLSTPSRTNTAAYQPASPYREQRRNCSACLTAVRGRVAKRSGLPIGSSLLYQLFTNRRAFPARFWATRSRR